ncbi:MAG: hypothetical protein PHG00_02800 [Methylococcales bacterium]|nr:hypothetical protein [Methylococcales bacterium]
MKRNAEDSHPESYLQIISSATFPNTVRTGFKPRPVSISLDHK